MRTYVRGLGGRIVQLGSPGSNRVLTGQSRSGSQLPHSPIAVATVPPSQGLAVLVLVRHAARFAALFVGWAAWGLDAEDSHCLQAQGEALAAVGRGDVQAGELLHALEPVADRVAV